MKWLRVISIFLLGVGLLFTRYFINESRLKQSVGQTDNVKEENIEIVNARKDLLLPDLHLLAPKRLYIEEENGVKKLRFDTTFFNKGKGPLELIGETNEDLDKTIATQVIDTIDGGEERIIVGEFVFHTGHKHWHVERYALFQLWRYGDSGELTELMATTDKFSFCIWDEHPYDLKLENAPQTRQYPRCPKEIQGNSIGWGDTYPAYLEGQEIDITNVPDGKYMVLSSVNADNSILESDFSNNSASLYIQIIGNKVIISGNP